MKEKPATTKEKKPKSDKVQDSIEHALFRFQSHDVKIPKNGKAVSRDGREYTYPLLDDVLGIIKPVFQTERMMYTQVIINGELVTKIVAIDAPRKEGFIESNIDLGSASSAQDFGARITYARRYGLLSLLGLTGDDDTDAVPEVAQVPPVSILPATDKPLVAQTATQNTQHVRETDKNPQQPEENESEAYKKAWNAIQSCKNHDAFLILSTRIEESKNLNDDEKNKLRKFIKEKAF